MAAERDDGPLRVTDADLHAAVAELQEGGELTHALLGARPPGAAAERSQLGADDEH